MFDRVVVPLDLGPPADRALPVAQAVARRLGARLDALMLTSRGVDPRVDEREARWHARSVGCELDGVELRTDDHVVEGILAVAGGRARCCAWPPTPTVPPPTWCSTR